MTRANVSLAHFYRGWDLYQQQLIAVRSLTAEQLSLRMAPTLRPIGDQLAHIVAVRARWLLLDLREGAGALEDYLGWDGWSKHGIDKQPPARSTAEIVTGLEATWQVMQAALER